MSPEAISQVPILPRPGRDAPPAGGSADESFGALMRAAEKLPCADGGEETRPLRGLLRRMSPEMARAIRRLRAEGKPETVARFLAALLSGQAAGGESQFRVPSRMARRGELKCSSGAGAPSVEEDVGRAASAAHPAREKLVSEYAAPGTVGAGQGGGEGSGSKLDAEHTARCRSAFAADGERDERGAEATGRAGGKGRTGSRFTSASTRYKRGFRHAQARDRGHRYEGTTVERKGTERPALVGEGDGETSDRVRVPESARTSRSSEELYHGESGRFRAAPQAAKNGDSMPRDAGREPRSGGAEDGAHCIGSGIERKHGETDSRGRRHVERAPDGQQSSRAGERRPGGQRVAASAERVESRHGGTRRTEGSGTPQKPDATARRELRQTVVERARYLQDGNESRLKLNVNSAELGRVDVRMRSGEGRLDVQIGVQNTHARGVLEGEMADLERALEDLLGGRAQAELHDRPGGEQSEQQNGREGGSGPVREDDDKKVEPEPGTRSPERHRVSKGELNVFV